jgi:hypothetical protein
MPLGPFPFPDFSTPARPARKPRASAELSVRASELRSEPERARLADTLLEPVVAGRARGLLTIGSRPRRAALKRNLGELVPLVERLCDGHAIDVRGAAMTARLVSDTQGPLYRKGDLRHALRAARMALDDSSAGGSQPRAA